MSSTPVWDDKGPNLGNWPFPVTAVGGIPFARTDPQSAVSWVLRRKHESSSKEFLAIRLANAYCVALGDRDVAYGDLLRGSGINLPDGAPIAWMMNRRSRKPPVAQRVRGPSFFVNTIEQSQVERTRHYFLGATSETLAKLETALRARFPSAVLVGFQAPAFGPVDDAFFDVVIPKIIAANPDIVWIALGTPKQDFAADGVATRTGITCIGVGAAFDFVAGTTPEAPMWIQRSGFEWLFRLISEPKRLWKRYLLGNVRFLISTARHR